MLSPDRTMSTFYRDYERVCVYVRPLVYRAPRPSPNSATGGHRRIIAEDGAATREASRRDVPPVPSLPNRRTVFRKFAVFRLSFVELLKRTFFSVRRPPPFGESGDDEESRKTGQSLKASQHDVTLALTAPPSSLGRLRRIRRTTRSKLVFRGRLRNGARSPPLRTRRPPFYGTGNPEEFLSSLPHRPKARRTYALALRSGFRLRGVQS